MKTVKKICCLLIVACTTITLNAQDAKDGKQSAEEKAWMEYSTPGKMHEMLAKSNGLWNEEVTFWKAPGASPTKMNATCVNRMIMGGRYQQGTTRGSFDGMPFEGVSTTGYDNAKKMFFNTWVDNMGTGIMYMEGPYNESTKTVEMKGKMMDPASGKELPGRQTIKFTDENNQYVEMFSTGSDGKEYKNMEMRLTKKEVQKMPGNPGERPERPTRPTSPTPPTEKQMKDK